MSHEALTVYTVPSQFVRENFESRKDSGDPPYQRVVGMALGSTALWVKQRQGETNGYSPFDAEVSPFHLYGSYAGIVLRYFGRYIQDRPSRSPHNSHNSRNVVVPASDPLDEYNCHHFATHTMPTTYLLGGKGPAPPPIRRTPPAVAQYKAGDHCILYYPLDSSYRPGTPRHSVICLSDGNAPMTLQVSGLGGNLCLESLSQTFDIYNRPPEANTAIALYDDYIAATYD